MLRRYVVFLSALLVNIVVIKVLWDTRRDLVTLIVPTVFALIPLVNSSFKERSATTLVPAKEYGLRLRFLVPYGICMIFSSIEFVGFVSAIVSLTVQELTIRLKEITLVASILFLPLGYPWLYMSGRWMGRRSMLNMRTLVGMLGVVASSVLAVCLVLAFGEIAQRSSNIDTGLKISFVYQFLSTLVLTLLPALYGYWRGRRQIVGAYMGYLLNKAPDTTRDAIFDLAYEEVVRHQSSAKP